MVNHGRAHTVGADYYLDHPKMRKFKSAIYGATYNLIDNDGIRLFRFEDGQWNSKYLNMEK